MARVCLVTSGQPSTNPRLVKEADALVGAGHSVHVIGAHRAGWADESDRQLLEARTWTSDIVDRRTGSNSSLAWAASVRHRIARLAAGLRLSDHFLGAGLTPVAPELAAAACAHRADLYIAHNLGALPAAVAAAVRHDGRLGFDAEDFHSGQFAADSSEFRLVRQAEQRFLPRCDYITASAPGIADRYAALVSGPPPTVILNVFPSAERPRAAHPGAAEKAPRRLYWFSQTIGADRGLEDAVAALAQLQDLDLELHLRGEWQTGYEDRLLALARNAGLRTGLLVAHPPASASEMVRLAAPYDIGLALEPAHSVNNDIALSNKIFTYVLAGVPLIASATTGQLALAATLGEAAKTVPVRDATALAAALRAWLADQSALGSARRTAWDLGTRRFNWDLEQQTFLSVVDRALGKQSRAGHRLAELAS